MEERGGERRRVLVAFPSPRSSPLSQGEDGELDAALNPS